MAPDQTTNLHLVNVEAEYKVRPMDSTPGLFSLDIGGKDSYGGVTIFLTAPQAKALREALTAITGY